MGELILTVGVVILCLNGLTLAAVVAVFALDGRATRHQASKVDPVQNRLSGHDWRLWEEQLRPAGRR